MAALTVFTGCTGDLDVQPLNPSVITGKDAYTDAESYTKGLNKIYSVWALSGQDGPEAAILQDLIRVTRLSRAAGLHCRSRLPMR